MDEPVIGPDLRSRIADGYAAVVATCDERLRPTLARAWGIHVASDGRRVTCCVEAPAGGAMRANLERGGVVALTGAKPSTYASVQMKGQLRGAWEPTDVDLARARAQRQAFAVDVVPFGIEAGERFMWEGPLYAIAFDVQELYDQTPGPAAGGRL